MNSVQTKSLIQLLGLGSLAYGLFAAWDQYQQVAGLATAFLGTGNEARSMFDGLMDSFNMGLGDMIIRQPWTWIGVVLIIAPYLIGLGSRSHRSSGSASPSSAALDLYVQCGSCGEAVRESAPFCPHCAAARS